MQVFAPKKRVLVADDEQEVCSSLKRYLERKGLKVTLVPDGLEAKRLIQEENFDYFLLDCSMPDITGIELVSLARQRNPGAIIILLSGIPSVNTDVTKGLGGDRFMHKPIQLSEFDSIFTEERK